jgi:pimeloyl-ACP methyl ester carboxylesterase
MIFKHLTPHYTVDAPDGTRYAYWRYGEAGTVPLVFVQPFWGNTDVWYPALVHEIAMTREVILFDASGMGLSTGEVPATFRNLGTDALSFIDALRLPEVDLFDSSGVRLSSGDLPAGFKTFGQDSVALVDLDALSEEELSAFAHDGFLAADIALERPQLVRRLVLAFLSEYPHNFVAEVQTYLSDHHHPLAAARSKARTS